MVVRKPWTKEIASLGLVFAQIEIEGLQRLGTLGERI
jgi:hypothetical protein